jgi:hypothetical protein
MFLLRKLRGGRRKKTPDPFGPTTATAKENAGNSAKIL